MVGLSDAGGNRIASYDYDAWGNLLTNSDSQNVIGNKRLYSGYLLDDDLGLYYLKARMYDPEIGRFLSKDPVEPVEDSTQSYNLYLYTDNNPVNRFDPDGKEWLSDKYNQAKKYNPFGGEKITNYLYNKGYGDAALYLSNNNKAWKTAMDHPYATGAGIGVAAGVGIYAGAGAVVGGVGRIASGAKSIKNISVAVRAYKSGGGGVNILNKGKSIARLDWHKFKQGGKMLNRPHVDIKGVIKHWPWKKWRK